jgi:hypothetical protein
MALADVITAVEEAGGQLQAGRDVRVLQAAGPVSEAFLNSSAFVEVLVGPFGSGKTTTCVFKCWRMAVQAPIGLDGWRRVKGVAVRDTYPELYRTLIPTWLAWFLPSEGEWTGGSNRPAKHVLKFSDKFGPIELTMDFVAIGDQRPDKALDGYEPTFAWLNGLSGMSPDVLTYMVGRVGRFPALRTLPAGSDVPARIIADTNATDVDHWIFEKLVQNTPEGTRIFMLPGGRSPSAENIANLPVGYYDRQVKQNADKPWWVKIFVDNQWGPSRDGDPVYLAYQDHLHRSESPLEVLNSDLFLGIDAGTATGGQPAAVLAQRRSDGQLRVLLEAFYGRCGPTEFARRLRQDMALRIGARLPSRAWFDPSASFGVETGELGFVAKVGEVLQVPMTEAPGGNELSLRIDGVAGLLTHLIDGQHPGLLLDPSCMTLRKGFVSHYRHRISSAGKRDPRPEKNEYSHLQDALQYVVLGLGYGRLKRRDALSDTPAAARQSDRRPGANFNVWKV